MRRAILWGASGVVAVLIAIAVPSLPPRVGDGPEGGVRIVRDAGELFLYYSRAAWVADHTLPYRDVFVEYPQGAALWLAWPRILTDSFESYQRILVAAHLLLLAFLAFVTDRLLAHLQRDRRLVWLYALPAAIYFAAYRFDALPAVLVLCAVWLLLARRWTWSILFLIFASYVKWYPLVLLPLAWHWMRWEGAPVKTVVRSFASALSIGIAVFLGSWLLIGPAIADPYRLHLAGRTFESGAIYYLFTYFGVDQPTFLTLVRSLLLILQGIGAAAWAVAGRWLRSSVRTRDAFLSWSALLVAGFMLFAKFYSPQWHLWVLPLFLLLPLRRTDIILLVCHDLVSFVEFPVIFDAFGPETAAYQVISVLRTIILIILMGRIIVSLRSQVHASAVTPGSTPPLLSERPR